MADSYITIGSTGTKKKIVDLGDGTYSDAVTIMGNDTDSIGTVDVDTIALYPVTPVNTAYTPSTTAYLKVTPNAANLSAYVRALTTSDDLIWAGIVTHKIIDATSIAAADATDLASSKTLIDEIMPESNTHFASTAYHMAADSVWYAGHKVDDTTRLIEAAAMGEGDLAAGYTLYAELKTDLVAHAASTTHHASAVAVLTLPATPDSEALLVAATNAMRLALVDHFDSDVAHSAADVINSGLVTATAADATDTAGCRTNLNLYKTYLNSHFLIGDATADDLAAVVVGANAARAALLGHFGDTATHGGIADATNLTTLTAVPVATDLATAQTLITAEKDTLNLHYAIDDNDAYQTEPAGVALDWNCAGSFFCRTSTSGGTFVLTEYRSA